MVTRRELEQWLQEGILAAKNGQREQARSLLLDLVEQDQTNEAAWYWLYQVFEHQDDKRICLENLITINPANQWAIQELAGYGNTASAYAAQVQAHQAGHASAKPAAKRKRGREQAKTRPPRPVTLKLVTAFWFGISTILLGGGIMATGEWLVSGLRNRTIPDNVTAFQALELFVALAFVIVGIIGLNVAIGLFIRSMVGFYGSIFLALTLVLVGPTVSLIVRPPNYVTMVCTGGIFGMIVLLTLASQPGFEDTSQNDA